MYQYICTLPQMACRVVTVSLSAVIVCSACYFVFNYPEHENRLWHCWLRHLNRKDVCQCTDRISLEDLLRDPTLGPDSGVFNYLTEQGLHKFRGPTFWKVIVLVLDVIVCHLCAIQDHVMKSNQNTKSTVHVSYLLSFYSGLWHAEKRSKGQGLHICKSEIPSIMWWLCGGHLNKCRFTYLWCDDWQRAAWQSQARW